MGRHDHEQANQRRMDSLKTRHAAAVALTQKMEPFTQHGQNCALRASQRNKCDCGFHALDLEVAALLKAEGA